MPYTTSQLTTFFTNANAGTAPSAAQTLTLTALANQNAAGTLTDAQALGQTIDLAADSTTAVSVGTYQFFLGFAPSQAGLQSLNAAFVGTGAQAGLNGENRFIAQSVALALQNSTAKTAFSTAYGSLSIVEATKAAYNIIIGNAAATAAGVNVDNAVAFLTSAASQTYYTNFVKANVPGLAEADVSLAVKAAIVGEIMFLATTYNNGAGLGSYATATTNLIKDLADDGNLTANNANGISLFANYGAGGGSTGGTPGSTFALTTGIDTLNGTANDDTFTGVIVSGGTANADLKTTVSALDTITGGAGTDTLNIIVTDNTNPAAAQGAVSVPAISTTGVENINIRTLSSTAADVTTVAAGSFVGATQFIADRSLSALTVTGLASGQAVGFNGVSAVGTALVGTYGATAASTVLNLSNGVVDTAGNGTSTVTLNGAGVTGLTINSTGSANAIAGVTAASGNVSSITVNAGVGTTLGGITGFGAASASSTATLTVNGGGNVTLGGLTAGTAGNVSTLNITTGSGTLNTGAIASGAFAANATINVSGAASTTAASTGSVNLGTLGANVKTLNASGLTNGGVAVTIGANTATVFTGGAGTDVVTIGAGQGAALTGAIAGGAGTDVLVATTGADLASSLTALVTGFETLRVSNGGAAGTTQTFDPTVINGLTSYQVGASTGAVALQNLVASSPVTITGNVSGTAGLDLKLKDASGANDSITVTLNNLATTGSNVSGVTVSNALTLGGSGTAGQIETLNIVSAGRNTGTGTYNNVTLGASGAGPNYADANKVVITGSVGLQLTTATSGHSITIDGSAAGPLNIVATGAVTGTQTIITGAANDTVNTGGNTTNLYAGAGGDSITLGAGVQTIVYKAAADSLLDLTGTAGASGTAGTVNAGKMDVITSFVSGTDKLDISTLGVNGALTAGVVDKGTVASDSALTALLGTSGIFSDGITTRGLTQIHYGADLFVVVDVNKNGAFDAGSDLVVKLVGVGSVAAGDFVTTN